MTAALLDVPSWIDRTAACSGADDPDMWYPISLTDPDTDRAKAVCWGCPLRQPCAEWAITHETDGVWGGLDEQQREHIRQVRREFAPQHRCAGCSQPYTPRNHNQRYCTKDCAHQHRLHVMRSRHLVVYR